MDISYEQVLNINFSQFCKKILTHTSNTENENLIN